MILYFQVQFLKLKGTENTKSTIKSALKNERKKKVSSLNIKDKKRKCKELKRDLIESSIDSKRQYQKREYQENPEEENDYKKMNIKKILIQKKNMEKEIPGKFRTKKTMKKAKQGNS